MTKNRVRGGCSCTWMAASNSLIVGGGLFVYGVSFAQISCTSACGERRRSYARLVGAGYWSVSQTKTGLPAVTACLNNVRYD